MNNTKDAKLIKLLESVHFMSAWGLRETSLACDLVKSGADPLVREKEGWTLGMWLSARGHVSSLEWLIERLEVEGRLF